MKKKTWTSLGARLISEYTRRKSPESAISYLVQKSARKLIDVKNYPPFSPEDFIKIYEEIEIRESCNLEYDAKLIPKERGYIVEINNSLKLKNAGRYNYCFFHEIAHSFFFECESKLFNSEITGSKNCKVDETNEVDEEEYLCNIAAAEFLMPKKHFIEVARSYKPGIANIKRLANLYGTSILATISRIIYVKAWECLAVKCSLNSQSDFKRGFKKESRFYSNDVLGGKIGSKFLLDCLLKTNYGESRPGTFDLFASLECEDYCCVKVRPTWIDVDIRIESEKFFNEGSPYFISLMTIAESNIYKN